MNCDALQKENHYERNSFRLPSTQRVRRTLRLANSATLPHAWHENFGARLRLCKRKARAAETVSRGLRSKRISRGRKQDTEAKWLIRKMFRWPPGCRYSRS